MLYQFSIDRLSPGADPGFQVRGAHLKKLRRAERGAKIVGVFRVKNHDFTPTNHILPILGQGARNFWGISCEKSRYYAKKIIFLRDRMVVGFTTTYAIGAYHH